MMQGQEEYRQVVQGMNRAIWWGRKASISCVSDYLCERNQIGIFFCFFDELDSPGFSENYVQHRIAS